MVRSFDGSGPALQTELVQEMRDPSEEESGVAAPTLRRGLNRYVWDLTVPGPNDAPRGGPMVVPGTYVARLTVDGLQRTRSFEILMDPRGAADGVTVAVLQAHVAPGMAVRAARREGAGNVDNSKQPMLRRAHAVAGVGQEVEEQILRGAGETQLADLGPVTREESQQAASGLFAERANVERPDGIGRPSLSVDDVAFGFAVAHDEITMSLMVRGTQNRIPAKAMAVEIAGASAGTRIVDLAKGRLVVLARRNHLEGAFLAADARQGPRVTDSPSGP